MKKSFLLTFLLSFLLIESEAGAAGLGGGGGNRAALSGAKRSPMTGSQVQRPVSRPNPKPVERPRVSAPSRPDSVSGSRPGIERPSVQKPDGRPTFSAGGGVEGANVRPNLPERPNPGVTAGGQERLPDGRPSVERPGQSRPATLPGMVSYPTRPEQGRPNLPSRPGVTDGGFQRPGLPGLSGGNSESKLPERVVGLDRPSIADRSKINTVSGNRPAKIAGGDRINVANVNIDGRNRGLRLPETRPVERRDWDANRWGGNNSVWGNNINISGNDINVKVNNSFRRNNNFACRPNYWGARPWWGVSNYHGWHHGHWGYGWNSGYYHRHWWFHDDHDFAAGFMWGIGVWSLGNLIYDMGYQSYRNPYPAPVVQNTYVTYAQPISVAAAANPPGDEALAAAAEVTSTDALARSRSAFAAGDYLTASVAADEAIAASPGDVALHEYRALVFFALGKYSDAAGVLNPVLASGPGWSWETMQGFYGAPDAYSGQLAKLEAYTKASADRADGHFLLGYHYLVCGHMSDAGREFAAAAAIEPADTISRQLAALTGDSVPDGAVSEVEPPARPDPVPVEKLVGSWSVESDAGKVVFTMEANGDFSWSCSGAENTAVMRGTYGLDERGLLVLTTDDMQMVSAVSLDGDNRMEFILVGAPDGESGLSFTKS